MYNYYIKLSDARYAIMDYIGEQTVSKYASAADCKLARDGAEGAMNALDYMPPADVVPKSDAEKQKLEIWRLQGEVERLTVEHEAMRGAANSYKMHYENLAMQIFNDLKANQIPCVSEDGAVFFCIKSKTFKQLRKKYMRATDEL